MERRDFLGSLAGLAALARMPSMAWAVSDAASPEKVAAGTTELAFDLYAKLRGNPGNLFCSPFSIVAALAMTGRGAANETLAQMSKVLHMRLAIEQTHADFAELVKLLTRAGSKNAPRLDIANAIWGQAGFKFKGDFVADLKKFYESEVHTVDFAKTEDARKQINTWVEKQTNSKIKELFGKGILDSTTRMVLANAIYFKGTWVNQFDKEDTKDAPFHTPAKATVPMMHQTHKFQYGESDDWQAVQLPYRGGNLAMVVVLPRAQDGLAALEGKLSHEMMSKLIKNLNSHKVQLSFPRFKSESGFSLAETLGAMGMPDAFSREKADFSRMSDQERLMISAVVHKAYVDVNEEGTEAAAATGVGVAMAAAPVREEPKVMNCDHPFLYLIRDSKTGTVLFMGRLVDPKA